MIANNLGRVTAAPKSPNPKVARRKGTGTEIEPGQKSHSVLIADNSSRATAALHRGPECRKIRSIIGVFACGWNTRLPFLSAFSGFEAYRSLLESEGQVEYFENSEGLRLHIFI